MNLNNRLIRLVGSTKWLFGMTVLFNLTGGIFIILWAQSLAQVINHVFLGGWGLERVFPIMEWMLAYILVRALLLALGEISAAAMAVKIKNQIRHQLMEKLTSLETNLIKTESSGALAAEALQGVELLDSYFSQYLPQLILAAFLPILILMTIFPLDWITGVVLALTAPLIPIFMILIGKASESLTKKQFGALRRMSAFFLDTIQGLTTLKLLNQSKKQNDQIASVGEKYRETTMQVLRLTFLSALALEWLATLSVAVVAVEIGVRLLAGEISFEQAFFILVIAPEFYLPLRMVGLRFHASATGAAAAKNIFRVLDEPNPGDTRIRTNNPKKISELKPPFHIEFDAVSYLYPGREEAALNQVCFTIEAGKQTALVGKSGAGKSTSAALLLGLIFPSQGTIKVDGTDLSDLPIEWWRSKLAWVPQKPFLYNASLKENVILGKPSASQEEIWQAVKQANLEEVICHLPYGMDTMVGEGGGRLSGGQSQRVALARAFLRNAPIIIMDEPTAHLDPIQEELLIDATKRLCHDRTVLTIAHRLATVFNADQIIVLEKGRVVEKGNHMILINQEGAYSAMVKAYRGTAF